ncbi:MAG: uracil-DNA glycosylase family protein [Hyphomicrobiaceae bacterium]|nr:uracil-DNA glycosylase family protein [Hyphomicrobiaceae bacterium]
MASALDRLVGEIRSCRVCADQPKGRPLPHEPRPVLRVSSTARLAIAGQAPGTRVHASGTPFSDPSGDRLRDWMGVTADEFYDVSRVAIIPMGFCFPGLDAAGSDLPPRRECAPLWHTRLMPLMPRLELILLVGLYAQRWHIGTKTSLTETVGDWRAVTARQGKPRCFPLPHPSWRNNGWLNKNPWFETELLPELRGEVRSLLGPSSEPQVRKS